MTARHAILGLLMNRPMHGYEIDSEFEAGLRQFCHVNISQIYAYLKSLEDRGWVDYEMVMQRSNPPKKVYHLTDSGRDELLEWLDQPVEVDRQMRDEFLTKLFFCRHIAPNRLRELITNQLEVYRARLTYIQSVMTDDVNFFTYLLLEGGRRHAEADATWLEWLLQQFDEHQQLFEGTSGLDSVPEEHSTH